MCSSSTEADTGSKQRSKSREPRLDTDFTDGHDPSQDVTVKGKIDGSAGSGNNPKIKKEDKRKEKKKLSKQKRKERMKLQKLNSSKHQQFRQAHMKKLNTNSEVKTSREKLHKGHGVQFHGKKSKQFHTIFEEEQTFIVNVMKRVPKLGQHEENLDAYLLDSDESEAELNIPTKPNKKRKHDAENGLEDATTEEIDMDSGEDDEAEKRRKFLESLDALKQNKKVKVESDVSREELKARLAAKVEALRKEHERTSTKPKKKKKKDKQSDDKKKQFISKPNPNAPNTKTGKISAFNVKDDTNSINSTSSSIEQKTPLRKNKVVKSNGQVVYSKFDFISDDKYYNTKQYSERKAAPKPVEILKKVEKYEKKVSNLETSGKISEAVALTEEKKWATAIKRAQGEKVRDDPTLLKKTIKKENKLKDVKRKKWKERQDHVEKQKQKVQDKRQANIQERKDKKKKRALKLQRKRGRIA